MGTEEEMGLNQLNFDGQDKVEQAIAVIRAWQPKNEPYELNFSGGKDSVVLHDLAVQAGANFRLVYCRTGIDHPALVQFIREHYPQAIHIPPKQTIWNAMMIHGLPIRQRRWCCEVLKEHAGDDKLNLTGIRAEESARRKTRCIVELQGLKVGKYKRKKTFINPIFLWTTKEVWEYIRSRKLPYCKLYDQGYDRLGCVLCPMATVRKTLNEWKDEPKIAEAWFRAAKRYWEKRKDNGNPLTQETPEEYIWWWLTRGQVSVEKIKVMAEKEGLSLNI